MCPGINWSKFHLGAGALVFAADCDDYASADRGLADPGCQAAFGRLGIEYGHGVSGDEFLLEPAQVYPFLQSQAPAAATVTS